MNPVLLCGSMFQLETHPYPDGWRIERHRLFEASWPILFAPACQHDDRPVCGISRRRRRDRRRVKGTNHRSGSTIPTELGFKAMGIPRDAMTVAEISDAVPPSYSRWIAERFLEQFAVKDAGAELKRGSMAKLSAAKRRAAQAAYYKAWYARTQKAFVESQGETRVQPRFVWRYATEAQRCEKLRALKAQRERKRQDAGPWVNGPPSRACPQDSYATPLAGVQPLLPSLDRRPDSSSPASARACSRGI